MGELFRFLHTRWVELLITGIWLQSVVSAAFSGSWLVFALTTFGGLALLAAIFWLVGLWRRRKMPSYGVSAAFAMPRQAVMFTVGMQKHTISFALQGQHPAWLGMICTRRTEPIADEIAAASGLDSHHIQKEIVDPWSVVEVRTKTAHLLDWLARQGIERSQVAMDITGGTAVMSAGAFSMASERQVDSQYVRSDYDEDNRPIPGTQRGVFVARYDHPTPRSEAESQ